jgi:tight adherence protein B
VRVALVAALFLATAGAASAGVRITGVDAGAYPSVTLTVVGQAGGVRPQVEEDGTRVTPSSALSLSAQKSVVLAVDRSRSMSGGSLADATAAARAFVAAKSASDDIEVVSFGHTAQTLGGFSSATGGAEAALDAVRTDQVAGTALFDAIALAARGLSTSSDQGRVIVVVTDGSDVSSRTTLAQAVAAARRAHAAVYAVGIASPAFHPGDLRTLASETGGEYVEAASSAQLVALYRSIGNRIARTWQIRYVTGAAQGASLRLTATAGGETSPVDTVTAGGVAATSAPQTTVLSRSAWRSSLAPLVVSAAVGLLVLLAALALLGGRGRNWLNSRLAPHLGTPQQSSTARRGAGAAALPKRLFQATERALADVRQFRSLQRLLAKADLPLLASELVYICVGSALVLVVVTALAGAPVLVALLLGWLGATVPILVVTLKARRRISSFDDQLPDILTTISASLKAGHSFRHAIQSVVDEGADPAAKEFRRVLAETRLGRPMDTALGELSERIGSKNLSFALSAVTIQRQIGGSLAGLFEMVADTVRARQQFARKIKALTAMGRMSAYVLVGLPFVVALLVSAINASYMAPLWGTSTGHELVAAGLVMIVVGSVLLRKIVSFRG